MILGVRVAAPVLVAAAVFVSVAACGSKALVKNCTPGQSVACTGAGGCAGDQTCRNDGSGYDTCACGAVLDSGSPDDAQPQDANDCGDGQASCNGVCTDVVTNATNCGVCGHDCLGGGCKDARCIPVTLADKQASPVAIALDAQNVFWLNEGTVANTYKGASVIRLQRGKITPQNLSLNFQFIVGRRSSGLVLDAANVFFHAAPYGGPPSGIHKVPKNGSTGPMRVLPSGNGDTANPYTMTLIGSTLFWVDFDENVPFWNLDAASTSGGVVSTIRTDQAYSPYVVSDPNRLYLSNTVAGTIMSISTDGQTVKQLASGQQQPISLTTDGANVYWCNLGVGGQGSYTGAIMSVPAMAGATKALVKGTDIPQWIAVDATDVYFVHDAGKTLSKVSKNGGMPVDIAQATTTFSCLTVDQTGIFLCDSFTYQLGAILMLAK